MKFFDVEKETLSPKQVANFVTWKEVRAALLYHYPGFTWLSYKPVFDQIRAAKSVKRKDPAERLEVYATDWSTVYYTKQEAMWERGANGIHSVDGKKQPWSLSFRPWKETMTMPFTTSNLKTITFKDLIAHYLYEITWYGPEAKMLEKRASVLGLAKEAKKDLKSGKLKTYSMEEVFGKKIMKGLTKRLPKSKIGE